MTALVRASGVFLLVMAALDVANRELDSVRGDVRVVVLVGVLAKLTLGTGLLVLSRYVVRRGASAFFGIWLISALCTMYLVPETLVRIPGVSVQLTLPGQNVLNTANMNVSLAGGRPSWFAAVDITLALFCLALLAAAVGLSASIAARSLQPYPGDDHTAPVSAQTPGPPPATATKMEVRTAVDPWPAKELSDEAPRR